MLSDFFEGFIFQTFVSTPNGLGGFTQEYTDGAAIRAGITTNSSAEMRLAAQQGLKTVYTIVAEVSTPLHQGDRVKRVKDGTLYTITSNCEDMVTPPIAGVQFHQVTAEVIKA